MKGRDFPASRSLLALGPFSSSSSLRRSDRGFRAFSSAMRLSMADSDSGTKGRKLSGPGGTSSCAILSSCSFGGRREAQLGRRATAEKKGRGRRGDGQPVNEPQIVSFYKLIKPLIPVLLFHLWMSDILRISDIFLVFRRLKGKLTRALALGFVKR